MSLEGMKLLQLLLPEPGSNCNETVSPLSTAFYLLVVFGFYSKDDAGTGAICSVSWSLFSSPSDCSQTAQM